MKINLGAILLLVALALSTGYLLSEKEELSLAGFGGQDIYIIEDFTQATSSISNCKRSVYYTSSTWRHICTTSTYAGIPDLLQDANTARQTLECYTDVPILIWPTNTVVGDMISGPNSPGRIVATTSRWNMKDYGYVWPGKIYAIAESATATVSCIEN